MYKVKFLRARTMLIGFASTTITTTAVSQNISISSLSLNM